MTKSEALILLRKSLNNPNAEFRDGQWESIEQMLNGKRCLIVQRTGWGKSMVYFLGSKIIRESGSGPTLLISPLLALMRNQIEAAERIGIRAITINSTNTDAWDELYDQLERDEVDVLLVSPERLANDDFRNRFVGQMAESIGALVVDEAHCISDWGHDFRPDYQRIVRILDALPSNIPVLATTATANERVVQDIKHQMGENTGLIRGSLVRKSLKLQNLNMSSPVDRLAWLAQYIPQIEGSGIVYTLTQRDANRVAEWLRQNNIAAEAYHADIGADEDGSSIKEHLEQQLLNNEIKVLVATVALGMGFDKPDLGFVIHYQRPASVVHYYQQVGRAGRAVDNAHGILMCGEEDDKIADYFIRSAFPPQQNIQQIFDALDASDEGLSVVQMQRQMNLKKGQIDKTLKYLTVESPSPIVKIGSKWQLTAAASDYEVDQSHIDMITGLRREEQSQMQAYMQHTTCLMSFLQSALSDPNPSDCGKCVNCDPSLAIPTALDHDLAVGASLFVKRSYIPLPVRKRWPAKDMFEHSPLEGSIILAEQQLHEGRALSLWRDAGWGQMVAVGRYEKDYFPDELVDACVEMIAQWAPDPKPEWLSCIPSLRKPELVAGFAERLAAKLQIPFVPCLQKVLDTPQQKTMENSYHQVRNLDGAFQITDQCRSEACLLVDDMIDSGWTCTVAGALLGQAGCEAVFPLALALNSPRMD